MNNTGSREKLENIISADEAQKPGEISVAVKSRNKSSILSQEGRSEIGSAGPAIQGDPMAKTGSMKGGNNKREDQASIGLNTSFAANVNSAMSTH